MIPPIYPQLISKTLFTLELKTKQKKNKRSNTKNIIARLDTTRSDHSLLFSITPSAILFDSEPEYYLKTPYLALFIEHIGLIFIINHEFLALALLEFEFVQNQNLSRTYPRHEVIKRRTKQESTTNLKNKYQEESEYN
jgi:hypothetical protein